MRKIITWASVILVLMLFNGPMMAQDKGYSSENTIISIIPWPEKFEKTDGNFRVGSETKIYVERGNQEALRIATILSERFKTAAGYQIPVSESEAGAGLKNAIFFTSKGADRFLGKEGYQLNVNRKFVTIQALEPSGLFYGMQTILQLLPAAIEGRSETVGINWDIPCVKISDKPRFEWRGMHLDVVRHFEPVAFIKKFIDYMAMHKLNVFHWHLTDDQGWRLEIKKYPKLTEIGAWRSETIITDRNSADNMPKFDGKRYGGYYTQDEAKEIVKYAKDRFITVVPEIEMPGHATAAIASYPDLGCTQTQVKVATHWGVFPNIFNLKDQTFSFLQDVLTEVMSVFPGEYIHVGGDEAVKNQWKASGEVQQKMKDMGLKDEHELQSYFINRIGKFLTSKGRRLIGWDEILEGGLPANAAVMSWRGIDGGIAAAKSAHDVVMAPGQYLYFWNYQGDPKTEPIAADGYLTLEKVYQFDPVPQKLTPEEEKYIIGAEGTAWAEFMDTPQQVEYQVFPRMSALAEVVWSPKEAIDWENFALRMLKQFKRYGYLGINYAKVPLDIETEFGK